MTVDTGPISWAGLNHLALITNDMDTTVRFWHGVLDAELVATVGTDTFRHYFFDVGNSSVAFFEYRDREVQAVAKPAGVFDERAGHFDHLSLNMPDRDAVLALQKRLQANDCEVTGLVDHGLMESIYFTDPNGIALEASYWRDDPTGKPPEFDNAALFADPDPVPAVAELRDGTVSDAPRTRLVDEPTGDIYSVRSSS